MNTGKKYIERCKKAMKIYSAKQKKYSLEQFAKEVLQVELFPFHLELLNLLSKYKGRFKLRWDRRGMMHILPLPRQLSKLKVDQIIMDDVETED